MNHIVLFEPEIPQNTGNIMRTAVAMNMTLHLIEPLGFHLDDKSIARSSVNYEGKIIYEVHDTFEAFAQGRNGKFIFLSRYGDKAPDALDLSETDEDLYLIFGSESSGIPKSILRHFRNEVFRIPMHASMRSLNLSNTVAIVAYEVMRQQKFKNLSATEVQKGEDFLDRE
jgi:tRNA (cytidine/uridine-2'-O-)-methyltransferase